MLATSWANSPMPFWTRVSCQTKHHWALHAAWKWQCPKQRHNKASKQCFSFNTSFMHHVHQSQLLWQFGCERMPITLFLPNGVFVMWLWMKTSVCCGSPKPLLHTSLSRPVPGLIGWFYGALAGLDNSYFLRSYGLP